MATTIDTRANVKTRLGISGTTDDALLDLLMESADRQIVKYVGGRTFPAAAEASITEYFQGNHGAIVIARPPIDTGTPPVIKVDSARVWGASITALVENTDYQVDYVRGLIYSLKGNWYPYSTPSLASLGILPHWSDFRDIVKVVYKGDGPADDAVKQAFALLVLYWYQLNKTESDRAYRKLAFDSRSSVQAQRYRGQHDDTAMPDIVKQLLQPYRRVAF